MSKLLNFGLTILDKNNSLPKPNADSAHLQTILSIVFGLAGSIALLIIIIAGFTFIVSGGDPQKIIKSRQAILYAVVGLVISVFAFVIVQFVIGHV